MRLSAEEALHRCLAARHQSPFTVGGQPGAGALVLHGLRRPAAPAGDPQGRRHLAPRQLAPRRLGQPRRSLRVQSARALAAPRWAGTTEASLSLIAESEGPARAGLDHRVATRRRPASASPAPAPSGNALRGPGGSVDSEARAQILIAAPVTVVRRDGLES